MKVGIVTLMHESNTFADPMTPLAAFRRDQYLHGSAIRERFRGGHHEVSGFFEGLDGAGIEAVGLFAAWTMPSGRIEADAARQCLREIRTALSDAGPLDGILVAPHGAAVAQGYPYYDGVWLSLVRELVGPGVPIIGTLDLHANLSRMAIDSTDALVAYRTNPHLDQRERGLEAASLMHRTLRREIRPSMAAAFPPMLVNIEAQATGESPFLELIAEADRVRAVPGVLSVSLIPGFPYADVPEMGASVIVVTDNDPLLARACAEQLANGWYARREAFLGRQLSPHDAVRLAATEPGPVCLMDMGDNVGGGSPADGTILAHELRAQGLLPAVVVLCDPASQELARRAGVGSRLRLSMGGSDGKHGEPIEADVVVEVLADGKFEETQARHGGVRWNDQGPTAIVETDDGLAVMLTTLRMPPMSLCQLTAFGIDPKDYKVLIAKGVHAPFAAYAPVCPTLIRVDTPGITRADIRTLQYRHRRRPLYPFED